MTETEERAAVVAEALTWLRTPWHDKGRVKGVGVDCAMFLAGVFETCCLIPRIEPKHYPRDWAMHRDEKLFEEWVAKFGRKVDAPQPGDVVLYQFGRVFSHGAIVIDWPRIIHADRRAGMVTLAEGDQDWLCKASGERAVAFWSFWPRAAA